MPIQAARKMDSHTHSVVALYGMKEDAGL